MSIHRKEKKRFRRIYKDIILSYSNYNDISIMSKKWLKSNKRLYIVSNTIKSKLVQYPIYKINLKDCKL